MQNQPSSAKALGQFGGSQVYHHVRAQNPGPPCELGDQVTVPEPRADRAPREARLIQVLQPWSVEWSEGRGQSAYVI